MRDDDTARSALRALAGAPVPAARTTVGDVVAAGRRRQRRQRAGAVAGAALTVVAAVLGSTLLLRGGPGARPGEPPVPVASRPVPNGAAPGIAGYSTVPVPAPVLTTPESPVWRDPTGRPVVMAGQLPGDLPVQCPLNGLTSFPPVTLPSLSALTGSFVGALRDATGSREPVLRRHEWQPSSAKGGLPHAYLEVSVPTGVVGLSVDPFGGTPAQAAAVAAAGYTGCGAVLRKSAGGVVAQLYQQPGSMSVLEVFGPSGRMYAVFCRPERGVVLSDSELAEVGDALAALG